MRRRRNTFTVSSSVEVGEDELDVEIDVEVSPYTPARTYGPPEKCHPAEGGEVESWEVYENRGPKRIRRADLDSEFDADELLELVDAQADYDDEPDEDDDDRAEVRAENRAWNREHDRGDW